MTNDRTFSVGQMRWFWIGLALLFGGLSLIAFVPGEPLIAWRVIYFAVHAVIVAACIRMALREVRLSRNDLVVRNLTHTWTIPLSEVHRVDFAAPKTGKLGGYPFVALRGGRTIPLGALVPLFRPDSQEILDAVLGLSHAIAQRRGASDDSSPSLTEHSQEDSV